MIDNIMFDDDIHIQLSNCDHNDKFQELNNRKNKIRIRNSSQRKRLLIMMAMNYIERNTYISILEWWDAVRTYLIDTYSLY